MVTKPRALAQAQRTPAVYTKCKTALVSQNKWFMYGYKMPAVLWHNVPKTIFGDCEMATSLSHQTDLLEQVLGITARSDDEILQLIEKQLPLETLNLMMRNGIAREEVYSLIVNPRTLKHRRSRRQPLSVEESERAVRVGRILATAQTVLGERDAALNWLRTPKKRFGGRTPMEMIATEVGARMVEEMLIQIDEGMFA
jgi:putative toxin-antitoxin system antitoxin component (TIGR02293 family)